MACGRIFGLWMVAVKHWARDTPDKSSCQQVFFCGARYFYRFQLVQVHAADVDRRVPSRSTSSLKTQPMVVMFSIVFSCSCAVPVLWLFGGAFQVETRMKVDMNTTFGKIISQEELEEPRNHENTITSTLFHPIEVQGKSFCFAKALASGTANPALVL
jgi:hypothetical protein